MFSYSVLLKLRTRFPKQPINTFFTLCCGKGKHSVTNCKGMKLISKRRQLCHKTAFSMLPRVLLQTSNYSSGSNNDQSDSASNDPALKELLKELHADFESKKASHNVDNNEISSQEQGANLEEGKEKIKEHSQEGCKSSHQDANKAAVEGTKSPIVDGGFIKLTVDDYEEVALTWKETSAKDQKIDGEMSDDSFSDDLDSDSDLDLLLEEEMPASASSTPLSSASPSYMYEEIEEFPDSYETAQEETPVFVSPIPLERGQKGVYDVEELVALLRHYKAQDLCAIKMPRNDVLGDHMVIVSAFSYRHMRAMMIVVKKIYKMKMIREGRNRDSMCRVSGDKHKHWMALDLGNIILHIFMPEARETYDLETLWVLGEEYDEKSQERDPYDGLFDTDLQWLTTLTSQEDANVKSANEQ